MRPPCPMRPRRRPALVAVALVAGLAAGCAETGESTLAARRMPADTDAAPGHFVHCSGHSCRQTRQLGFTADEWAQITAPLREPVPTAPAERAALAQVVALFETAVAPKAGTGADIGGTFPGMWRPGQLDCVDESWNTGTLLRLLAGDGLLRWHAPGPPAQRGLAAGGWPHVTATVVESRGGGRYAVDSWFEDNGRPAHIVSLDAWITGWKPPPQIADR
ncbi:MAG: hypothetical protein H6907_06820 [Hyphomicrobiales bacterium]|nr:hypothetical protein [Hyphomicrobiales bacterium]